MILARTSAAAGLRARRRAVLGVLTTLSLAAGLATGCSRHHSSAQDSYGPLPSFLPSPSLRPDGVLTGTVVRPAVTSEGDAVRVETADGSVLATVTGPEVPGEGMPHQPETTTCTWTVALSDARGRVAVSVADFSTIDELGGVSRPRVVAGTRGPPASITAGQSVRFQLRAVMRVGEGVMRWAPGDRLLASWDFVAETD